MEILAGFNDMDVKAVVSTHRAPLIATERLVGDATQPATGIDDPLGKAEGYFAQLSKQLDSAIAALTTIRDQGLKYEQTKSSASLAAANAALVSVRAFFDNTVYGKLAMGAEMLLAAQVPPYVFRIMAGANMDQWENFPLGTGSMNPDAPELMGLEVLGLDSIDITKPSKEWLPGIETALGVFGGERVKIASYLGRISLWKVFRQIGARNKTDHWTLKKNMLEQDPVGLEQKFLQASMDYCEYSISLLGEIKKCAEENIRNLDAGKDSGQQVFHAQLLIDEVNRAASHAQFNGMNILTGRFAKPSGENIVSGSMWFQIGAGQDQRARVYLGNLTANALLTGVFTVHGWNYDVKADFETKQGSQRAIQGLDAAMARVRGFREELGRIRNVIPARSPLAIPRIFLASIKKRGDLVSSYQLTTTLSVTPKSGMSIPEQNALYFTALYTAFSDIYDLLLQLRGCHLLLCSAVYTDAERDVLLKKAAGIIERINQRAKNSYFAGKLLLPAAKDGSPAQITAVLDADGIMKKKLDLFGADAISLGISDVAKRVSWDFSYEHANRELGILDQALSVVRVNMEETAMLIESAAVAEEQVALYSRTMIKATDSAALQQTRIDDRWKGLRSLITDSLAQAEYFSWLGLSTVYTWEDHLLMQERINNELEDCELMMNAGIELLVAAGKNPLMLPVNKTRYAKYQETLVKVHAAFTGTVKKQGAISVRLESADDARVLLEMIRGLQKMIAGLQ